MNKIEIMLMDYYKSVKGLKSTYIDSYDENGKYHCIIPRLEKIKEDLKNGLFVGKLVTYKKGEVYGKVFYRHVYKMYRNYTYPKQQGIPYYIELEQSADGAYGNDLGFNRPMSVYFKGYIMKVSQYLDCNHNWQYTYLLVDQRLTNVRMIRNNLKKE